MTKTPMFGNYVTSMAFANAHVDEDADQCLYAALQRASGILADVAIGVPMASKLVGLQVRNADTGETVFEWEV